MLDDRRLTFNEEGFYKYIHDFDRSNNSSETDEYVYIFYIIISICRKGFFFLFAMHR